MFSSFMIVLIVFAPVSYTHLEFQLFQDEIQNVRTHLITPVIVDQMKIVDIRHQKGVLLFFASVIEKRKNFFFRIEILAPGTNPSDSR